MMRYALSPILLLALVAPATADIVFLKEGQRIEGEVREKGNEYEIVTELTTLTVKKSEVDRIVPSPEKIEAEVAALKEKARALYRAALPIEGDAKARNEKLNQAIDLMMKIADRYNEAIETYDGPNSPDFPKKLVLTFQEIRIYRDQKVSELASNPEPKPAPEKDAPPAKPVELPVVKKGNTAPPKPPAPPAAPPGPDVNALLAKAKGGNRDAQYALILHYEATQWDATEAVKWLKPLTRKNDPKAMWKMACLILEGRTGKPDTKAALRWLRKAEARYLALAEVELGKLSYYGIDAPRSLKKADYWCEKAAPKIKKEAEAGDPEAQAAYAWMLATGMGVYSHDPVQAFAFWEKSVKAGYAPAANQLGDFLLAEGDKTDEVRKEAEKWYELAAKQGYAPAQVNLFEMNSKYNSLWYPKGGKAANKDVGMAWLKKAFDQGHARAMAYTAVQYRSGSGGLSKDVGKAFALYQDALKSAVGPTLSLVQSQIGSCYQYGDGVKKNPREALKWFRAIANRGEPAGCFFMGSFYRYQGNHLESVKWLKLGAAKGHLTCMNDLGVAYATGRGVKKSFTEAHRWFLMSAQTGDVLAVRNLRQCEKDLAKERANKQR